VRTGGNATTFGERIQLDLFQFKSVWVLLVVDECTRYKVAVRVASREWHELARTLMNHWIRYFGPPRQLVSDQESSLMSHEAGVELERLGITRVPKGTTAGEAGKQHTGTGLVERHIGLVQLTMQKLEAELDRTNIPVEIGELAAEAAMAQNSTLN
jgi:hypothetical protein